MGASARIAAWEEDGSAGGGNLRVPPREEAGTSRGGREGRYARAMRRERTLDLVVALIVFLLTVGLLIAPEEGARRVDGVGVLLAGVASLPLVARRSAPLAVFMVTGAGSTALNALEYPPGPPWGPTVALYFLALSRQESRTRLWLIGAVVIAVIAGHLSAFGLARDKFPGAEILLGVALWGGAWVAGDRTRLRRERMRELEERALRAEREAERERQLAAAEERTRIARDLHDSAGHAINVILVQAGAARLLSEKDPERSRNALETIEVVARETLTEIEGLVTALRDEGTTPDVDGSVEPPMGVAALESLAQRHRAAGLDVAISVGGRRRPLPPAVDQAAYRIVQESLTNALLHGRGSADVAVAFADDALTIGVTNPVAPDARGAGGGHGIIGMRERALLVGGSVEAGPDDGTFHVRAKLPYAGRDGA
jgi:signal transduction histidine kinase